MYFSSLLTLQCRKDYPAISKNVVRQRLMSTHGHLAGKLGGGVLAGHHQVLSSYQYETGVPLPNSDAQDPISNPFQPSRDPGLLYHCFKHRGNVPKPELSAKANKQARPTSKDANANPLQIAAGTWSEDASDRVWRPRPACRRSTTSAPLRPTSRPCCLTRTAPRPSTLGKLACTAAWRPSPEPAEGTRTMSTATCGPRCSPTLGTPWRGFRTSPSQPTLPTPPLFPPWCRTRHRPSRRGLRLTWGFTTPLQSSGGCPLSPPRLPPRPALQRSWDQGTGRSTRRPTTGSPARRSALKEISPATIRKARYPSESRRFSTKWG